MCGVMEKIINMDATLSLSSLFAVQQDVTTSLMPSLSCHRKQHNLSVVLSIF
jgi:hypothetical protein